MRVRIGCDLVDLAAFKKSLKKNEDRLLEKIFSRAELLTKPSKESLAGIFAAKEAIIKSLDLKVGSWQEVEIAKNKKGRPEIKFSGSDLKILSQDLSISHHGRYVMAVAVFLVE